MKKCLFLICMTFFMTTHAAAKSNNNVSACLINAVTGEVVYEKNAYEKRPMASTTKIMTALIALENSELDDVVEMSYDAVNVGGSSTYAKAGDMLYMEDALFGLMLNSGNDAAEAIAAAVAGSREEFADMMNKRAGEMGAAETCFLNPSGLPQDGHYTTAYDLALITRHALKNEKFAQIVSTQKKTVLPINAPGRPLNFYNHNKLLDMLEGCIGVKTGYTKKAGRCLVSSAERDGMRYIAITLNDGDDWNSHREMYEAVFEKSHPIKAVEKGQCIRYGKGFELVAEKDFVIPGLNNQKTETEIEVFVPERIKAPVNKGEKVGYITISYQGEEIGRVSVISENDIFERGNLRLRKSYFSCVKKEMKKLLVS